jgi:cytochrome c oxidase subunit IV
MTFPAGMGRQVVGVLFALAMAGIIVSVDLAFFRGHIWERLAANVGIVLLFVAFYFRFLKQP